MLDDRPHVKKGQIKYTKGYRTKLFFSKTINIIILMAILAVLAASIFVFIKEPVKTKDGYIFADPHYEIFQHGENVVILKDGDTSIFAPIKRALVTQDYYYAKIVAGPYGEIKLTSGAQSVDDGSSVVGIDLEDVQFEEGEAFLDNEYVVREVDENKEVIGINYDEIVTKDYILGIMPQ